MEGCLGTRVYSEVPEGGWGWAVALAFFVVEVCTYGTLKTLGVFLQDLMLEFGESNSRVSWAISICIFMFSFTAPLATLLSTCLGHRPVVMMGGFLMSLGTITSGFINSIHDMYLTIGIITGLGYSLSFLPTVTLLAQYFSKRRALVTSLASSGESFAMFTFAPAFTILKENIGWRHCMVLIGTIQACVIGCGFLLCPISIQPEPDKEEALCEKKLEVLFELENEQTRTSIGSSTSQCSDDSGVTSLSSSEGELKEQARAELGKQTKTQPRAKLLDFSVLRDGAFICYSLFGLFATAGFFAPQLYVIELSKSRGVEPHMASYMLSVMAVAEIVGRLTIGLILTRAPFKKTLVLLACVLAMCLVLGAFTLASGFWALVICCAIYGYFMGTVGSTHIPLLAEEDVVGVERMASAVGVYICIQSFAGLAGPPLGGLLVDVMQNYGAAFALCAVGMALGAICLALVGPIKSCRCSGEPEEQTDKDSEKLDFLDVDLPLEDNP
ncbi:hypothetical protein NL108_014642 [Boleophthalmus pectinirostris]|uniref:solute carrier family 16 member 6b n=1 Tax=Boleophthalmus pectinirostris TaxID=150288 RepID=UPI000A1C2E8F|nr:solute carrier family 16 member 6b [Boleophthalmus pectinirostris]KAJ0058444.1 hypothetical protein NL108_014642 [Boleophthalmus pectinirostris]